MLNTLRTTSQPWPQSHHDLIEHYYAQYDEQIASGQYQPFLYPWGTLGALGVIIYLLIPHQNRPWLKKCRYLAFAWITGFATYSIFYTRARGMAPSLGVGLISAWSICWVGAILVCNDAQTDFQRIERLEGAFARASTDGVSDHTKQAEEENGETGSSPTNARSNGTTATSTKNDIVNGTLGPGDRHGEFSWQPYPLTPFIERLDWVCDIFCNFRGAGWNWRTSALPPPPKPIIEQITRNSARPLPKTSYRTHAGQVDMYTTRRDLLRENLKTAVRGYLVLDGLKTIMMHDAYFWGLVDRSPPPYFPFSLLLASPVLTHMTRLTLSMLAIKTALQTIFSLAPLLFAGLLGPLRLGARAEPWMYPETWAAYSIVLDRGLAGWWSAWWHQTFRFAFEQPGARILQRMRWPRASVRAKVVQLATAFGLSALVHASGSATCAGPSRPVRGPLAFFASQAVGIMCEVGLSRVLQTCGVERVPQTVRRVATFVYVHVWFYFTAHLLCDDFARGGVWLFEPVPVSVFRGVGLGVDERDGWWCWGGSVVRWHRGERWWKSGLAF